MAAKEVKKAADNLACSVCYQVFKNPKYLPCYHSFCEECLAKMQKGSRKESKITCPECRREATVPAEGVSGLPNNFLINRLVDELIIKRKVDGEEEVRCDRCEEADPVVSFCLDCGGEFLCHFCHESHKRDKRSRGHKIVPLAELRSNKDVALQVKAKIPLCKEHDYELKHYCETCDQLVCLYCTMKAHSNHSHDTVKNMAEKHRNELKKITAPIHKMDGGLAKAHDNTDKMRKDLRQHGDEVDKEIDQYYDILVQQLMKQKKQIKQQLHDTLSQTEKTMTMQLEEIEFTQGEVVSMKELKDAVEKSSDEEALSAKKQMITCMKQLSGKYNRLNVSMQPTKIHLTTTQMPFPQFSHLEIIRHEDNVSGLTLSHPSNPIIFATPDSPIVQRVSQDLRNDYRKNFARGGTLHFERFPAFTVRYPNIDPSLYPASFPEFMGGNLTDKYAKDILEKEFRCLNWLRECTHLVPLYTTGDGNCLLHAASLAMWGFEDRQFILRNALHESLTTADRITNTLQDRCRMSILSMLRDVQVNMSDNDWYLEWQQIVNQAKPNMSGHHQSLEESHIFVLANILRRPIIVYGVPKARSFSTGGTMQNINFHGIYLPLLWGSQLCHKPPLCLGYGMGHFTALVPSGSQQQQLVVPLTDNSGQVLPIRFLLQAEEQNTFYLLEQYLSVIQQYTSSLGKQIPVAAIALREATHMHHLVQAYIDMSLTMFNEQSRSYYTQSQPLAIPQGETRRVPCVGCDTGAFASAETNFLCSFCYKKEATVPAVVGYIGSQGLKCRSPGCQQQGLPSREGYCNVCYTKACNPGGEYQWNKFYWKK